ncbi:MAG: DUF6510 family protein [Actinomycetota bacterium]|nr:DUF6510 family protein [Actinomycetota bacterium]
MSELLRVDGNALDGVLSEVFAADLTMATTTCAWGRHRQGADEDRGVRPRDITLPRA